MKKMHVIKGSVLSLLYDDVDTDMIFPGKYLTLISMHGLGVYLFESWRREKKEIEDLLVHGKGSPFLIVGKNFGCGSSREHAVWALADYGIKVILGESFSDIFLGNCYKNGMLPLVFSADRLEALSMSCKNGNNILTLDLDSQILSDSLGALYSFDLEYFAKDCFREGKDHLDYLVGKMNTIKNFKNDFENGFIYFSQ